jgi:hypothetical protein
LPLKTYLIVIILSAAAGAFAFSALGWRSQTGHPVDIFLSTDLSPRNSGPRSLLPKDRSLSDAARLFVGPRPQTRLHMKDSGGDSLLGARQVLEFANQPDPKLVFAPTGSDAAPLFLEEARKSPPPPGSLFLDQATASTLIHDELHALSAYLPAADYFRDAFPLILRESARPAAAHILRREGVEYFSQLADIARQELQALGIKAGEEIGLPEGRDPSLLRSWKRAKVRPGDWVIVLDFEASPRTYPLLSDPDFRAALPIYAYGSYSWEGIRWRRRFINSWHLLNWHPWFDYRGHGGLSNCEFVRTFWDHFGYMPRFHGAHLYALLEAMEHLRFKNPFLDLGPQRLKPIPTILGPLQWDEKGVPVGKRPALLYYGPSGNTLFIDEGIGEPCASSRVQLQGTSIRRTER